MELDREALLAAVKAASHVVVANHGIEMFTKVWLMDSHVLAFNNTGLVIYIPVDDLPMIGGVDGKLFAQLLDRSQEETVSIDIVDNNQIKVVCGRSRVTLAVKDPKDYVKKLGTLPKLNESEQISFKASKLLDDMSISAMLNIETLKAEQVVDFSSLTFLGEDGRFTLFTCDRRTINRSLMKMSKLKQATKRLVPVEFMRTLVSLRDMFGEGRFEMDDATVIVSNPDTEAVIYSKLASSERSPDFKSMIGRLWPDGKVDTNTLVPIPDELPNVLSRAQLFTRSTEGIIKLSVADGSLTITTVSYTHLTLPTILRV